MNLTDKTLKLSHQLQVEPNRLSRLLQVDLLMLLRLKQLLVHRATSKKNLVLKVLSRFSLEVSKMNERARSWLKVLFRRQLMRKQMLVFRPVMGLYRQSLLSRSVLLLLRLLNLTVRLRLKVCSRPILIPSALIDRLPYLIPKLIRYAMLMIVVSSLLHAKLKVCFLLEISHSPVVLVLR